MGRTKPDHDKSLQKAIACRIKAYREASGKTIEEFADYMGLSIAMIRKLENGDSGFYAHKAIKIANFLGITVTTLLTTDNPTKDLVVPRKNLLLTARKLQEISDPTLRKNITDMISNLAGK